MAKSLSVFATASTGTGGATAKAFKDPAVQGFSRDLEAIKAKRDQGAYGDRDMMAQLNKRQQEFIQANPQFTPYLSSIRSNIFGKDPQEDPDRFDSIQNRLQRAVEQHQISAVSSAVDKGQAVLDPKTGQVDAKATFAQVQQMGQLQMMADAARNQGELDTASRTAFDKDFTSHAFESFNNQLYGLQTRLSSLTNTAGQAFLDTGKPEYRANIGKWQTEYKTFANQVKSNILTQFAQSGAGPDKIKALSDSMDTIITAHTSGENVIDTETLNQAKSVENRFGISADKLSPTLALLKNALGSQTVANLVQSSLSQKPEFEANLQAKVNQALGQLTQDNNTAGVNALLNSLDYLSKDDKNLQAYAQTQRQDIINHSVAAVRGLNSSPVLADKDLNTWFRGNLKLANEITQGSGYSNTSHINSGTWFANTNFASQFQKTASKLPQEKAQALGNNVGQALTISSHALIQRIIGEGLSYQDKSTPVPFYEKPAAFFSKGPEARQAIYGTGSAPVPLDFQYNPKTGRLDMVNTQGQSMYASTAQQQDMKQLNLMLDSISKTQGFNEAIKGLTPIQIKELAIHALLPGVMMNGESSLPQPKEGKASVTPAPANIFQQALTSSTDQNLNTESANFEKTLAEARSNQNLIQQRVLNLMSSGSGPSDGPSSSDMKDLDNNDMSLQEAQDMLDSRNEEGLRLNTYKDTKGKRTIGFGFNLDAPGAKEIFDKAGLSTTYDDVVKGASITSDDARKLFDITRNNAMEQASGLVSNWDRLSDNRKEVMADLVFNMGVSGVKKFKRTLAFIEQGDFQSASKSLMNSLYAKENPNRARRNAAMLANDLDRQAAQDQLLQTGALDSKNQIG